MTHYETLGIEKTATEAEIKKAYRKLAGKHHPDKGGDTTKFQEVQVAYDTLIDKNKRAQYDAQLNGGSFRTEFRFDGGTDEWKADSDATMNDIMNHPNRQFGVNFGEGFRRQQQAPMNQNVRIIVPLELLDTLEEQTKTIKVGLPGGKSEELEIKIPRGVTTGTMIRYPGLGADSVKDAPRGDLYVQFHVKQHENFGQSGIDLVTHLTINCIEAITGCEKEVKSLEDKTFKITVPPGTQFGTKFGLPNLGLYSTDHPGRGRLIVILEIVIPTLLNPEEINKLKQMSETL